MRVHAKVIDYSSGKPRGHTICLAIYKKDASAVPYDEHLPRGASVAITLEVNGVVYDAKLFARAKVPYAWISTALQRGGVRERLANVLAPRGVHVGDWVHLDFMGKHAVLI